jgi:tryptophanyl-tRNA synthetase
MNRVLTGITTTGTPHLGNYIGAIRPAISASQDEHTLSFFFLADYHALIKCDNPERIARSRLEIAATWLAAGLEPDSDRVMFYRQSDIPEISELTWLLTCVTAKGLMNRAHAYKAAVDANRAQQPPLDDDAAISMGLYSYPILMAADILLFKANKVPVGRDQVQHVEMARDMAQRFNYLFGQGRDLLVLPEAVIEEHSATVPGIDGRKMSKSYNNIVPLFAGGASHLREAIMRVVTDSTAPGIAKNSEDSLLFKIVQAFEGKTNESAYTKSFGKAHNDGSSWGELKEMTFAFLNGVLATQREKYEVLISKPKDLEEKLKAGATKARTYATPLLEELRDAVGLRTFTQVNLNLEATPHSKNDTAKAPRFKRYRDSENLFYFKLEDEKGQVLIQSKGFGSPQKIGSIIDDLIAHGIDETQAQLKDEQGRIISEPVDEPQQVNRCLDLLSKSKQVEKTPKKNT